jgi:hypothetical protein
MTGVAASNICKYSDTVDNSAWVKAISPTVTANAATAPDGTSTAETVVDGSPGDTAFWYVRQTFSVTAGQVLSCSISAKELAGNTSKRYFAFWINRDVPSTLGVTVDLATGAITYTGPGVLYAAVTAESGGWWRVNFIAQAPATESVWLRFNPRDEATKASLSGGTASPDGVSGFAVWRAQLSAFGAPVAGLQTTSAAVSGSGWSSSFPPANVLLPGRASVARGAGLAGAQALVATWPADVAVSCVVISRHNLSAAAVWGVELFDAAGAVVGYMPASPALIGSASGPGAATSAKYLSSPVMARSIRVCVFDPTNSAGYVQIGRLMAGQFLEPASGVEVGMRLILADQSTISRRKSGFISSATGRKSRGLSFSLVQLTQSERAQLTRQFAACGLSADVFVSAWPASGGDTESDYQMVGKITRLPALQADGATAYSAAVEIMEQA